MSDALEKYIKYPIDKETTEGYALLLNILKNENGYSVLRSAYYMYALNQGVEDLKPEELIFFAQRLNEASSMSYHAFFTEVRTDALITLLNWQKHDLILNLYEMPDLSREEMRDFLISCDDETFTDLVDYVAYCTQEYLKPEFELNLKNINHKISEFKKEKGKDNLKKMIDSAKERTSSDSEIVKTLNHEHNL